VRERARSSLEISGGNPKVEEHRHPGRVGTSGGQVHRRVTASHRKIVAREVGDEESRQLVLGAEVDHKGVKFRDEEGSWDFLL